MGKLVYAANASLDGYVEDEHGSFDFSVPDEAVHRFWNDHERRIGTSLYGIKDAQGLMAVPASLAQPSIEKAIAYSRGIYAIVTETQAALSRVFESQYATLNREVLSSIEAAAKHAPAGSEVAVTAVRQALDAANSAYDNITKATKQAVEVAESNVEAATSATLKAVSAGAAKAKKAA